MQKIPTLFQRSDDRRHVIDKVTSGCEWVLAGEGVATRKYDGTCVMIDANGQGWARREVKPGKDAPPNFVEIERDDVTGKTVGWEPIEQSGFAKFYDEGRAWSDAPPPGTYELVGPRINGNPERMSLHALVLHGVVKLDGRWGEGTDAPRDFEGLRDWLLAQDGEGIVWHHPDGRMAKLKKRDFATALLVGHHPKSHGRDTVALDEDY